jgi:hypothetical protein
MPTTVNDLLYSYTAIAHRIENKPDNVLHMKRLDEMCAIVDAVLLILRRKWPQARLSSGYRNKMVNALVGGSKTSDHPKALGFDVGIKGVTDFVPVARYLWAHVAEIPLRPQQILSEDTPPHLHIGLPDEQERATGYVTQVLDEYMKPDGKPGWRKI